MRAEYFFAHKGVARQKRIFVSTPREPHENGRDVFPYAEVFGSFSPPMRSWGFTHFMTGSDLEGFIRIFETSRNGR